MDNSYSSILALLNAIKADFPRRKAAAEALMKSVGIDKELDVTLSAPASPKTMPTFVPAIARNLTPMLKARFDFAGLCVFGQEIWLDPIESVSYMNRTAIRRSHSSLRKHWEDSAPMLFGDDQLSLFVATQGVPEDLTYLVWRKDDEEPQVWECAGHDSRWFANLEAFLRWCLERD